MKSVALFIVAASISSSTTALNAQTSNPIRPTSPLSTSVSTSPVSPTSVQIVPPYAVAPGGWQPSYGGTVMGSWNHGYADRIRAWGDYARAVAAASIDAETARQKAIDNWAFGIRTYQQIRDERVARDRAEHPPQTSEQRRAISHFRDPKRLSVSQLSPSGIIAWPSALGSREFDASRSRLDTLFAERATGSSAATSGELAQQIESSAVKMLATLADSGDQVPVMEQVGAKNFINSLRLEARQSPADAATTQQIAAITKR